MVRVSRQALVRCLILALVASLLVPASAEATGSHRAAVDARVLRGEGIRSVIVHVADGASWDAGLKAARQAGALVGTPYRVIKVFVAYGRSDVFERLSRSTAIEYLEANRRLSYSTDSSHTATQGQQVLDGAVTLPDGTRIDGRGVGVAVVDSGVDGTHPDLHDRMGGNVKMVCSAPVPVGFGPTGGFTECLGPKTAVSLPDTDTTSAGGHGTHVAGTIAGTGAASEAKYHGAAPGATLYGVSSGEALLVENALDGLAWVLANHDKVTPAIKVVNNSWGSGHAKYEPATSPFYKATWKLQEALVAAGVTVVFAAGNGGGNGSVARTSAQCVNPTPGIICVANFDDHDRGTRDGVIAPSSSRGASSDPATWPDLSAPGTNIVATCRLTLPVCNAHLGMVLDPPNTYSRLSGTSMAAPHVAGIAAQLLQANPALAPAQVEDVLEDTAYKFTFGSAYGVLADPFNGDDSSSFDKGHGLVDVIAALQAVLGITPEPDPTPTETTSPTPEPTETIEPGTTTSYYFHTSWMNNQADEVFSGGGHFDTQFPVLTFFFATANDAPFCSGGVCDAIWTGTVDQSFDRMTVDFWQKTLQEAALGQVRYNVVITNGAIQTKLPPLTAEVPVTEDPTRVTHTFTTMLAEDGSEVPLSVDPQGGPISITIRAVNPFTETTTIVYDSKQYPSGFSVSSGAAEPEPTESPSPSPEPTESPSPSPEPTETSAPAVDDPFFDRQWALRSIDVPRAWSEASATGVGIKVAVLYSGIDQTHEDLQCADKLEIVPGSDLGDPEGLKDGHGGGTQVAGIIGACTGNGKGIAGVAPDARILPFKTAGIRAVPEAIRGAADAGAHIINVSGSVPSTGELPGFEGSGTREAVEYANSKGAIVVADSGSVLGVLCGDPAELETVVCVGSVDSRDLPGWDAALVTKRSGPALVAPGGQQLFLCREYSEVVISTFPTELGPSCSEEGGYRYITGSAAAAAHVAGVAALVYGRLGGDRIDAARTQVLNALLSTATDLGPSGSDPVFGSGKVDAYGAVISVSPPPAPEPETTTVTFAPGSAESGQFSDEATIAASLADSAGTPIAHERLEFSLVTGDGSKEWWALTDETGTATETIVLDIAPGAGQLTVKFVGDDTNWAGSADTAVFVIDKEDSSMNLSLAGTGRDRAMEANLTETDTGSGLGGKTVEFLIDGRSIGTATTDGSGHASVPVPAKLRYGPHVYEAVFEEDSHYRGSSAKVET